MKVIVGADSIMLDCKFIRATHWYDKTFWFTGTYLCLTAAAEFYSAHNVVVSFYWSRYTPDMPPTWQLKIREELIQQTIYKSSQDAGESQDSQSCKLVGSLSTQVQGDVSLSLLMLLMECWCPTLLILLPGERWPREDSCTSRWWPGSGDGGDLSLSAPCWSPAPPPPACCSSSCSTPPSRCSSTSWRSPRGRPRRSGTVWCYFMLNFDEDNLQSVSCHQCSAVPASWPMHGSTHEFIKAQCHSHDNRDTLWSTHNNTHDHLVQQWRHWQRILCSQTLLLPPQHHRQVPDGGGELRGGQHLVWSIVLLLSVDETGRILVQRWHQLAQATALLKYWEKILNDWEWVVCTLKLNIIFKLQLDTLTRYWIGKTIRLRLFYCTMKQFSGPWPRRQSSVCRSALVVMIDTNNVGSLSCCHVWGRARTPN